MKKFLKQFYGVILGIFLLGVVFGAPTIKQWNNSKFELSQYRMLFTDTGLPDGTLVMDINSEGSNISYGPLLDGGLNPYITGGVLDGFIPRDSSDLGYAFWELPSSTLKDDGGGLYIESDALTFKAKYTENSLQFTDSYFIIQSDTGDFLIKDTRDNVKGIEYEDDYSAGYTDRSLVDKGYVDGELSGIETFWEFDGVTLNPTATGDVSLKIGLGSEVDISNSVSIGQYAYANGSGSYAFGNSAWALGEGSFAIGRQANADGRNAYSVGFNSQANQEDSYVFGTHSSSNGFGAMVFGQYAKANNTFSTAIGYSSEANADYSISAGNNTITNSVSSMAIGKYNVGNYDSVFEVGFGTNTGRANLFEVKNNGNIYISKLTGYTCLATDSVGMIYDNTGVFANYIPYTSVDTGFNNTGSDTIIPSEKAIYNYIYQNNIRSRIGAELKTTYTGELNFQVGALTYATGGNSIAMGYNAKANKYGAIAIGNECIVNQNFGIAMGYLATASGESSVSMGFDTQTNAPYSVAMGDKTVANGLDSVAFGHSTLANADHSTALGKYNLGLTGSIFEIGFGYNELNRSNLFTILNNGNVGIGTHTPTQALTVSGSMGFDNGTDMPFRFAYSGGLMEGQYYTGGSRTTANIFTP